MKGTRAHTSDHSLSLSDMDTLFLRAQCTRTHAQVSREMWRLAKEVGLAPVLTAGNIYRKADTFMGDASHPKIALSTPVSATTLKAHVWVESVRKARTRSYIRKAKGEIGEGKKEYANSN